MSINLVLVVGGIILLLTAITLLVVLKLKQGSLEEAELEETASLPNRHLISSNSSEQLRVIVSATKTSGTFARDQVIKQSQRSSLTDLSDLSEMVSKTDNSYSSLISLLNKVDNFAMPVASGKAATLKVEGQKLLQAIKLREAEANALKEALKGSSDKIRELIKKPYVLKDHVSLELLSLNSDPEIIEWSYLSSRVDNFCLQVREVIQAMSRYAKTA